MTTQSPAALELKRLRERAGYSVRQLAAALRELGSKYGRSPSSYVYYENDYKKLHLPVELVEALVPLLLDRGTPPISEHQLYALAGQARDKLWIIRPDFSEKQATKKKGEIEAEILAEILQLLEAESNALSLDLSDKKKAYLAAEIYRHLMITGEAGQPGRIDWEVAHSCRVAKLAVQSGE